MGKCKKRTLYRSNFSSDISFMTREKAVNNIFRMFTENTSKNRKKRDFSFERALNTISLFGISAEELSEAGLPYENLKALGSVIS